jgi:enoyl-CoA hydratase/carnithine racemase
VLVQIDDDGGVRTLTLNRPEALNAFNEALYDATTVALLDADADPAMIEALTALRKPLILAVNGLGVGIGATILGYADLVFMAASARLKCPFTSLGVAPEAASSYLLPRLIGRQNAAWMLLSSEWVDADEALRMGLAWKVCDPDDLMAEAARHAAVLASRSIPSLMAVKETIVDPTREAIAEAAKREYAQFEVLLGSAANADALSDFADRKAQ